MDDRHLKTARVRWRMGQPLLPEHFYTQEESLRTETNLRLSMLPEPQWGVGQLRWELSPEGRVRIRQLVLVQPDGSVLDVPGNCDVPAALELEGIGQREVSLYLHRGSESRFTHDSPHGDPDNVERTMQQLVLLPHPSSDPNDVPFKLAEVVKSVDDEWRLSSTFIPPSIRVAASPFFEMVLDRTRRIVEALHETMVEEIRNGFLSAEATTSARQCLRGIFTTQATLSDLTGDLDMHPARLWKLLIDLYLDVCVHRGMDPIDHLIPYTHRELGPCFGRILASLETQVSVRKTETPQAEFQRSGNMLVCELPPAARRAKQIYWLIQKERVGDDLELGPLKLASPERLPVVHQLALGGIPFRPILKPPFHHSFTSEVEFYGLVLGDEWDHAVREGKIGFYSRQSLDTLPSFLYWRND